MSGKTHDRTNRYPDSEARAMKDLALTHVQVVAPGRCIAGPCRFKLLVSCGERVIMVEPPGTGDGIRIPGAFVPARHADPSLGDIMAMPRGGSRIPPGEADGGLGFALD